MFERMSRSWAMVKASARVLRSDRELVIFPLISGLILLIVSASFAVPFFGSGMHERMQGDDLSGKLSAGLLIFLFYLVQYFIMAYANTALVGAAMIRLRGGDPTVRDGLRIAHERVWTIFGYALIAATVGTILRAISERVGFLGQIVVSIIGTAWNIATFLVIPVLAVEGRGPVEAIKRSTSLLKQTWGEQILGGVGIGLIFFLPFLLLVLLGVMGVMLLASGTAALGLLLLLLAGIGMIALMAIQAALSGIYTAAVYHYAATGEVGGPFDPRMLSETFRRK